jgi:hypothetical protein
VIEPKCYDTDETKALENFESKLEDLLEEVLNLGIDSEDVSGSITGTFDFVLAKRAQMRREWNANPFKF